MTFLWIKILFIVSVNNETTYGEQSVGTKRFLSQAVKCCTLIIKIMACDQLIIVCILYYGFGQF